jgi:hypothetical protein
MLYKPPYDEHFQVSASKVHQLVEAHIRKQYMKTGRRIRKLDLQSQVQFSPARDYFFDGYHVEVKLEGQKKGGSKDGGTGTDKV